LFVVVITFREFHRNPFSILAKRKKYDGTGQKPGQTEAGTDKAKMVVVDRMTCTYVPPKPGYI